MGKTLAQVVAEAHGMAPKMGDHEALSSGEPYFAPRYYRWFERPERERVWSPQALEFWATYWTRPMHAREDRISPSSMGTDCERELLFSFAGAPQNPVPVSNAKKMDTGTLEHLRWQMIGLSAGFLDDVEIWTHFAPLRCGGSADGSHLGRLFELKNTSSWLYEPIATGKGGAKDYAAGMVAKHKLQMETYWVIEELSAAEEGRSPRFSGEGSLVYQNNDTKDVHEITVVSDPKRRTEVHRILESLHEWIDLNQLPDMLTGCQLALDPREVPSDKQARRYRTCQYKDHCPTAQTVTV